MAMLTNGALCKMPYKMEKKNTATATATAFPPTSSSESLFSLSQRESLSEFSFFSSLASERLTQHLFKPGAHKNAHYAVSSCQPTSHPPDCWLLSKWTKTILTRSLFFNREIGCFCLCAVNAADSDDKFVYIASDMLSKILIREAPLNKRAKLRKHASQILMRGQGDMRRSQML